MNGVLEKKDTLFYLKAKTISSLISMWGFKMVNYAGIQKEIEIHLEHTLAGSIDPYALSEHLESKFIAPLQNKVEITENENPYLDLIFAMMEINGIELY